MQITDIRHTKRGRFSIYIDGEFACVLHADIFATCGLSFGDQVTPQRLGELEYASLEKLAKERALSLLAQREYTGQKLYEKVLEKVGDEDIAAAAVHRMQELGLVDDADYARRYALECMRNKGYSLSRTAQALKEKGIGAEIIEDTLAELDDDPQPAIAKIILRKYMRYLEDEKGERKTISALQRLGYRYGDIRTVLQNLAEDPAWYDDYN